MRLLHAIKDSLLHLAFPHVCEGCGTDTLSKDHYLCVHCLDALPFTSYPQHADNPVEQLFWGRLPVEQAAAHYYFTKESAMQHLVHEFKYRGHKELGHYLGKLMGHSLQASARYTDIDAVVPLPLHASKEHKRGFNQALILCEGIAAVLGKSVLKDAVIRTERTESQTKKSRIERWQNMEGKFKVMDSTSLEGKHILLVDDVVTTGATLEACGQALLQVPGLRLSIATLCTSSGN
jgi:ComF family protein